jgi:hypothetical protein
MGVDFLWVVVRREGRRASALALMTGISTLTAASCSGRSQSHQRQGGTGGANAGATGGVGGATGGTGGTGGTNMGKSVGGSGNVSGSAGKGAAGGGGRAGNGSGGTAGKGATGGVSGDAGSGTSSFPCVNPNPVSPNLIGCDSGFVHRPAAVACPPPPPDLEIGAAGDGGGGEGGAPSDCAGRSCGPGEACIWSEANEFHSFYECERVCQTDADCGSGAICVCVADLFVGPDTPEPGGIVGICRQATCSVDADCPADFLCAASYTPHDCSVPLPETFHCQTPMDECSGPAHCDFDGCVYRDDRFVCSASSGC